MANLPVYTLERHYWSILVSTPKLQRGNVVIWLIVTYLNIFTNSGNRTLLTFYGIGRHICPIDLAILEVIEYGKVLLDDGDTNGLRVSKGYLSLLS